MHNSRKPGTRPLNHPASAAPPPTKTIPTVSDEPTPANPHRQTRNFSPFKLICPVRARLCQPADSQVPQLRCPDLGREFVKERFARFLVDAVHLDRQPSVIGIRWEQVLGRFAQRRLLWQLRRILRLGQRFRSQSELRQDSPEHRRLANPPAAGDAALACFAGRRFARTRLTAPSRTPSFESDFCAFAVTQP